MFNDTVHSSSLNLSDSVYISHKISMETGMIDHETNLLKGSVHNIQCHALWQCISVLCATHTNNTLILQEQVPTAHSRLPLLDVPRVPQGSVVRWTLRRVLLRHHLVRADRESGGWPRHHAAYWELRSRLHRVLRDVWSMSARFPQACVLLLHGN
jgi:hypothetical protein